MQSYLDYRLCGYIIPTERSVLDPNAVKTHTWGLRSGSEFVHPIDLECYGGTTLIAHVVHAWTILEDTKYSNNIFRLAGRRSHMYAS